jgi:hypothetical protein
MACTCCSVIPFDGSWIVECEKVIHGSYMSNGMALRVATSEALAIRRLGRRSRISVQNNAGDIIAEYCLCDDLKMAHRHCPHLTARVLV